MNKRLQVVRVARIHSLLIGKFVASRCLRGARFERARYGITSEIVRSIIQARTQKGLGLPKSNLRKRLQIFAVHKTMLSELRVNP